MQCPSCRFENMPGSQLCARCRANLAAATMVIDVNPPRASGFSKAIPQPLTSTWYRTRFAFGQTFTNIRQRNYRQLLHLSSNVPRMEFAVPQFGRIDRANGGGLIEGTSDWFSLIVPGLVHYRHGEKFRGSVFFGIYIFFLFGLLLFAGTAFGAIAQGLMFAWHLVATVDAVQRRYENLSERVVLTLMVAVVLGCCAYWPVTWTISRVALPISINITTGSFLAGDVLLINQIASTQAGDYVLYNIANSRLLNNGYGYPAYQIDGQRIGRLVAVAGQSVAAKDGVLTVDGIAAEFQPKARVEFPSTLLLPDTVFILPENLGVTVTQLGSDGYLRFGIVSAESIQGVVYMRTHPFSRFTSF